MCYMHLFDQGKYLEQSLWYSMSIVAVTGAIGAFALPRIVEPLRSGFMVA